MSIEDIKNKAASVLKKYPTITEAYLFGSTVRGEAGPDSDVDVIVKFSKLGGLFQFVQIKLELQNALGKKVDLVQDQALRKEFRSSIEKDKIKIF